MHQTGLQQLSMSSRNACALSHCLVILCAVMAAAEAVIARLIRRVRVQVAETMAVLQTLLTGLKQLLFALSHYGTKVHARPGMPAVPVQARGAHLVECITYAQSACGLELRRTRC